MTRRLRERYSRCGFRARVLAAVTMAAVVILMRRYDHRAGSDPQMYSSGQQVDGVRGSGQRRTKYTVTIIVAVMAVMILGLSLIRLDIPDPLVASLLLGVALALAIAGVLVWWPEREVTGSKGNLGAALLGGAVITFTVFGFQLGDARRQAAIDRKYQRVLINVQAVGNNIQEQSNNIQTQAIHVQQQGANLQRQLALTQTRTSVRQLEALQHGQVGQPYELVVALQKDLTGIDLHGKDLSGYYLRNKVLVEANLNGANLSGANLQGTDLRGADFRGTNFKGAIASRSTKWPTGFDPQRAGVKIL